MVIYKYKIEITDFQEINIQRGGEILTVGFDLRGELCIWAMVNPDASLGPRWFEVIGTGNRFPDRPEYKRKFLQSVISSPFVWHVFELTER